MSSSLKKKSTPQTLFHGPLWYAYVIHHIRTIYLQFRLDFVVKAACMNIQLFLINNNIIKLLELQSIYEDNTI